MTKLTEEQRASYMAELGLSDPLWVQYLRWVKDIVRGNFGHSFFRSESVADMILRRGPLTAEIALISVVLSWLVGIPGGHRQRAQAQQPWSTASSRFISILFLAVPGFWVGMLIVLALLFWFGYRAPMAGVALLHRSRGQPADRDRAGDRARAGPGRLHRAHGAARACSR